MVFLNLWPGEKSLVAKVEHKAGVHNVLTVDPGHRCVDKFQSLLIG